MIISIYGIIIFMYSKWIEIQEKETMEIVEDRSGFSRAAIPSRHEVTCNPVSCF